MNESLTDMFSLRNYLLSFANSCGMTIETLGYVGEEPMWLFRSQKPGLLVAAGFHGEEPAGCWGVLRYLAQLQNSFSPVSFLPIVNPTGIEVGSRKNAWGENPNSGFCHDLNESPSREGVILLNSMDTILSLSKEGFISLHEDVDATEFYLYTFEHRNNPGDFSRSLVEMGSKYFPPMPDGLVGDSLIRNGVVFNECDGSFEDHLFHSGVPRTACTETPGALDFELRVQANADIIDTFVKFHVDLFDA